jgi:hypothetical protein
MPEGPLLSRRDFLKLLGYLWLVSLGGIARRAFSSPETPLASHAPLSTRAIGGPWSTYLLKDNSCNTYAYKADGTLIAYNTPKANPVNADDSTTIAAAINNTDDGGRMLWLPGTYLWGGTSADYPDSSTLGCSFRILNDLTIYAYGATLKATRYESNGPNRGYGNEYTGIFKVGDVNHRNTTFGLYGLTIDQGTPTWNDNVDEIGNHYWKNAGDALGAGQETEPNGSPGDYAFKMIHVSDCTFLNVWNHAITVQGAGGIGGTSDATLLVENCTFDHGFGDTDNEAILAGGIRNLILRNIKIKGNKIGYWSARYVTVENLESNTDGASTGYGIDLTAEQIYMKNIRLIGNGITIRPWGAVQVGSTIWGPLKTCIIDGLTINRNPQNLLSQSVAPTRDYSDDPPYFSYKDKSGQTEWIIAPLIIQGFDDINKIQNLEIQNFNLEYGHIRIEMPHDYLDGPKGSQHYFYHSTVDSCRMRNIWIENFDGEDAVLRAQDHDFGLLEMINIRTPAYASSYDAPIKLKVTTYSDKGINGEPPNSAPMVPVNIIAHLIAIHYLSPTPSQNIVNVDNTGQTHQNKGKLTVHFAAPISWNGARGVRFSRGTKYEVYFSEDAGLEPL